MDRLVGPTLLTLTALASIVGCSRGSSQPSLGPTDAAMPTPAQVAAVDAGTLPPHSGATLLSAPIFSAPIAGARVRGELVVAGLVAAEGVVRVTALTETGPAWTVDAIHGVGWLPDADLKLHATAEGIAVVWRGTLGGKTGTTLVFLGPHGEARGEPLAVGAASCTTAEGAAWVEPRPTGPINVYSRRWAEPPGRQVATLSADRAPTLVCAEHTIVVLGDGDEDVTAAAFGPGAPSAHPAVTVLRNDDFGDDDERDHFAYTFGDDFGFVRVGSSGAIVMREVPHGASLRPSPWRRLKHKLPEDDDVVAVDGDASATVVVYTRDAGDACGGGESAAASVRALRVDRKTEEETVLDLAKPDCDRVPGPFWLASAPGALVASWTLRTARTAPGGAPIVGMAYRTLRGDGATTRLDVEADALADAGCDETGCYAAALVRAPDNDGGRPEAIRALRYP